MDRSIGVRFILPVMQMDKIKLLLTFILWCCVWPAWSAERSILVLGDSLSAAYGIEMQEGWVNLLQQRLAERHPAWRVINASISGDTTAGGLSRLPPLLEQHSPHIVILELGSNDGLRGLNFRQLRQNLQAMIDAVEQHGGKVLLVGGRLPPNYGAAYSEAFHNLYKELATARSLPLVPFLLDGVAQDRNLMLADGYHPSREAQTRILQNVWPVLEGMLESML